MISVATRLLMPVVLTGACLAQAGVPFDAPKPQELAQILLQLHDPAPTKSVAELYEQGVAYAALEQLNGNPQAAMDAVRQLDASLPAHTDSMAIAAARRRYALLGAPLPYIPLAVSLFAPNETPRINRDYGSVTILLLFQDTCAPCISYCPMTGSTHEVPRIVPTTAPGRSPRRTPRSQRSALPAPGPGSRTPARTGCSSSTRPLCPLPLLLWPTPMENWIPCSR